MPKRDMVATQTHAAITRLTRVILFAVSCCLLAQTAVAAGSTLDKKKKPKKSGIELSTSPDSYEIRINGESRGRTPTTATLMELPPGRHTVEILMPNNTRWVREFDIAEGRKYCLNVSYRPRTITVARPRELPCPYPVNVSAPSIVNEGDVITFSADVTYEGTSALNYTWTVSPASAKILSGAGTPTITVDSTGLGKQRITAILIVDDGSGDPTCRQTAQAATNVLTPERPNLQSREFDRFVSVSFDDDKARLDNLAVELQNTPDTRGYIIVYGGRRSRAGQADRLGQRARDYLVNTRRLDPNRIVVINGGYRERDEFEVWIVPEGAQPPQPTPTVQPSELRPGRDTRPRRPRRGRE